MRLRRLIVLPGALLLGALSLPGPAAAAEDGGAPKAPAYRLNRADEDYRYLRDPSRRSDFWDPIKYLPLDSSGEWYLSFGGEARERFEYFNNPNWGRDPRDRGYFLQRYFLHADLHLGERARLFSQLQSSLEGGRAGGPRPTDRDELDLHQLFLDLTFPLPGASSLTLRSGRQELAYGSQRIISVREGPNVRQSFDGFRLMYQGGGIRVDGFATRPAQTKPGLFDDGTDHTRALWGGYAVLPLAPLPEGNLDLYYLGFYRGNARFDQGSARETRHSAGARLWRSTLPLDYNFEALYQWGSFGTGEISAWTVASDTEPALPGEQPLPAAARPQGTAGARCRFGRGWVSGPTSPAATATPAPPALRPSIRSSPRGPTSARRDSSAPPTSSTSILASSCTRASGPP